MLGKLTLDTESYIEDKTKIFFLKPGFSFPRDVAATEIYINLNFGVLRANYSRASL